MKLTIPLALAILIVFGLINTLGVIMIDVLSRIP